ncbi:MAG: FMN-binding protein [Lachnospiraceae bacterium]|nr:FMN-binding protein [Lachnospiraceae bacterium]
MKLTSLLKKLAAAAPMSCPLVVAACMGVSLTGYTRPVFPVEAETEFDGSEWTDRLTMAVAEAGDAEEHTIKENGGKKNTEKETEEESKEIPKGSFDLKDGVYEGEGTGFAGKIKVAVTIEDGTITKIEILEVEADDEAFFNRAKGVIDKIITSQQLDVDVVSGATYSSKGIIHAVKNALTGESIVTETAAASAGAGQGQTTVAAVQDPGAYRDGVYYGSGTGFGGAMQAKVTIQDGKIAGIEIVSHSDGASYMSRANGVISAILASQSTNVDTVSGATYSSVGIIQAVRSALSQAAVNGAGAEPTGSQTPAAGTHSAGTGTAIPSAKGNFAVADGVYYGTAEGFQSDITVAVTVKDQTITGIQVQSQGDDAAFFNRAVAVIDKMVQTQSTAVDTVSGATFSSNGIIHAVEAALASAPTLNGTTANPSVSAGQNQAGNHQNTGKNDTKNNDQTGTGKSNTGNGGGQDSKSSGNFPYVDGVYYGTGEGFEDDITLAVTIKDQCIQDIQVVASQDDAPFFDRALRLLDQMIAEQTTDVDTVSGATYSSIGLIEAVQEAIAEAKTVTEQQHTKPEETKPSKEAESQQTETKPEESKPAGTKPEETSPVETDPEETSAAGETPEETSAGDTNESTEPEESTTPEETSQYRDGTYIANGLCEPDEDAQFDSYTLSLQLTVSGDRIVAITDVTGDGDASNDTYIRRAANGTSKLAGLVTQITEKGTLEGIDTVSRATCSSKAIIKACQNALEQAVTDR